MTVIVIHLIFLQVVNDDIYGLFENKSQAAYSLLFKSSLTLHLQIHKLICNAVMA